MLNSWLYSERSMFYNSLRTLLFKLEPELAHRYTLQTLALLHRMHILKLFVEHPPFMPLEQMGLNFRNPVGLAAGLDKNGDYIDALGALGFGFIEVGTVTPKPQIGNPKPRLFRLSSQQAMINRMGFNNKGVDYLVKKAQKRKYAGILGINIGKNASTPLEKALDDYRYCLKRVYPYADYVALNISSPNTPGLRNLQSPDYLNQLLLQLKNEQTSLAHRYQKYVPLVVKISPDLSTDEIEQMATVFSKNGIDGVIATNTTVSRTLIEAESTSKEAGGLSGEPLFSRATEVLKQLRAVLDKEIPIIASGGIMSRQEAQEKIDSGASLVQLYSGLIYQGPSLIKKIASMKI